MTSPSLIGGPAGASAVSGKRWTAAVVVIGVAVAGIVTSGWWLVGLYQDTGGSFTGYMVGLGVVVGVIVSDALAVVSLAAVVIATRVILTPTSLSTVRIARTVLTTVGAGWVVLGIGWGYALLLTGTGPLTVPPVATLVGVTITCWWQAASLTPPPTSTPAAS